jgi:hypothetical protein
MNLRGDLVDGEPDEMVEHDRFALSWRKSAEGGGE